MCYLLIRQMIKTKFSELVLQETDIFDYVMSGNSLSDLQNLIVDNTVQIDNNQLDHKVDYIKWQDSDLTVKQFDQLRQSNWFMPETYASMDIAQHVLSMCRSESELQRVGKELLLYQEKGLFPLLCYLTYLVNTMKENQIIWGVGRGSSVASYVLYLLGVHKIDSIYYDLDPEEFLR